jgi:hypothetical protein
LLLKLVQKLKMGKHTERQHSHLITLLLYEESGQKKCDLPWNAHLEMTRDMGSKGPTLQAIPRNSSRDRGAIPSLAELGEQSAWVLPVWNVASWSVFR